MKIFIFALTTLTALCTAQTNTEVIDFAADAKMINPDFLFDHARDYQNKLTELQGSVNEAVEEVQSAVSRVLKVSTAETLRQYQLHMGAVESEYAPHLETFNRLAPGSCRNSAETILNSIMTFTGYDASNCANVYDLSVTALIANASNSLVQYDDAFSQIQLIVWKAFVGENTFVTPEAIKDKITEIYGKVLRFVNNARFDSDQFVSSLSLLISQQNLELGNCHDSILEVASNQFAWFRAMAQTCEGFNESQGGNGRSKRSADNMEEHEQLLEDFKKQFAQLKYYEWKA